MSNLIDKIPEIIEKSGNLYGLFALLAILTFIIVYFFYRGASNREKNRAFLLILLFFGILVLAALTVGLFKGFERGEVVTTEKIKQDPLLIKISPDINTKLENFIRVQGDETSEGNKVRVLEEALESYIDKTKKVIENPLSEEILRQKCEKGDAPNTKLIPKENYHEGEYITINFANACPDKTIVVVRKAGYPTTKMDTGEIRRAILLRKYAGELTFSNNDLPAGSYEIQAFFSSDGGNVFISGISDRFNIVSRF